MTAQSPFDKSGAQFAWDSHSLKTGEECYRKYYYQIIQGWAPREKSVHLLFGGWYATALEHYYKYRAQGMESQEALREVVRETLIETWIHDRDKEGNRLPGTGTPWQSDHNAKTRDTLIRTIVWYVEQFEGEAITVVIKDDGTPAVEHSFTLEIDNGQLFCGHIDRLVDYSSDIYVMDQKTTGSTLAPYYFDQFKPDMQFSGYTFAGKIIYGVPVKGVIIDAAQIAVGFSKFDRGFSFRTESELNEWYDDTMLLIENLRHATVEQRFPMNKSSCNNFGGCPFRKVCARAPEVREHFLKSDFIPGRIWNPLERR